MWERILTYEIQPEDAGRTVAEYLRSRGFSRHLLIRLKTMPDGITLDGVPVLPSHRFFFDRVKSLLTIRLREEEASEHIAPVPLPLTIVYEDEDLLVLDKPPDMPIHPSMGNYENTLANALAYYYEQQERPFIFRCINRLDRDTSGLLIVAKNAYSSVVLSAQMKERHIHREYLAVVQGLAPERGTIDAPIGRQPGSVIERCVDPVNGDPAVTHFTRMAISPNGTYSLLRIRLDTGRTHQIRVHMGHIGHPLPGDFLYCPDYRHFKRQPLHSHRLSFSHPVTGEEMTFTSPLPEDCHPDWFML
ncbi:RluA family pseudouridine synthase [Oscillospiraceae bacterium NTUH-002-81]|nr:RluA family pseudouridine synthase [Oscillospiraceae bacterium NTUH-002-81]